MNELKAYYKTQIETQPESSLTVRLTREAENRRPRIVKRIALIAATVAILTTTVIAASPEVREAIWNTGRVYSGGEKGIMVDVEVLPVSEKLAAYINENEWNEIIRHGWDGQKRVEWFTKFYSFNFESYNEAADFFGIDILQSPMIKDESAREYMDTSLIRSDISYNVYSPEDKDEVFFVSLDREYQYGTYETDRLGLSISFILEDESSESSGIKNRVPDVWYYQPDSEEYETYVSSVNGIEAMVGVIDNDDSFPKAFAVFTVNSVRYSIWINSYDPDGSLNLVVATLKGIIDSFTKPS